MTFVLDLQELSTPQANPQPQTISTMTITGLCSSTVSLFLC